MYLTSSMRMSGEYKYNCRIKVYPNGTQKLTVFSRGVFNPDGYALFDTLEEKPKRERSSSSVLRSDNVRRSKDKIFDIALANSDNWKYFITLTLDPDVIDRTDPKIISLKLKQWLNNAVKRKNLVYLIIPEYHKDGKSIHFHGLINDCDLHFVSSGHFDRNGHEIYNISDWGYGFTTAVLLDDKKEYVCKYITKYITKDIVLRPLSNFIMRVGTV